MTPALARRIRLCKHTVRDVVLADEQEHVTDQSTRHWQFCMRCGAYRWLHKFRGRILNPKQRIPWRLPALTHEAIGEPP